MPFPLVKPGEKFKPSASLSNAVRRHLNESNGFQSGAIKLKNTQIIRVPIYNTTESAFFAGQAVSIDLNGNLKGDCYPAVAYSDEKPCYGVALTDIPAGGIGDCALSGLAQVRISGQSTDGNFVSPTQSGVFARSTFGIPIVNITGETSAIVMLGNITNEGGSTDTGLVATVSGTTAASISVSGNSPLTIKAGANTTITGGTDGEIYIGGGSGFGKPDWSYYGSIIAPLNYNTAFTPNEDCWLAGNIEYSPAYESESTKMRDSIIGVRVGTISPYVNRFFYLFHIPHTVDPTYDEFGGNCCIPITAGTRVVIEVSGYKTGAPLYNSLNLVPLL